MTGGTAVVEALVAEGVDTIFGLPGIQNDWFYNALYDARDRIRVIHTRHEQGAAYMALGYALARGGIGVYNVVPGPGVLNTTAALATAYALNAQVLCLTGQIPLAAIGRDGGVLHEIPDQLGVLARLTKWAARATSVADARRLTAEAFAARLAPRHQPLRRGDDVNPQTTAHPRNVLGPTVMATARTADAIKAGNHRTSLWGVFKTHDQLGLRHFIGHRITRNEPFFGQNLRNAHFDF